MSRRSWPQGQRAALPDPDAGLAAAREFLEAVLVRGDIPAACPVEAAVAMAHLLAEGMAAGLVAEGMSRRRASRAIRAVIAGQAAM